MRLVSCFCDIPITAIEPAYRCVIGRKLFDDEDSAYTWPELLTAGEACELFRESYWEDAGRQPDLGEEEDGIIINTEICSRTRLYVRA
jgi:hypothetical protein